MNEFESPFVPGPEPETYPSRTVRISQVPGHEDQLLREHILLEGETIETIAAAADEAAREFARLRDQYGIRVVLLKHEVRKNETGELTLFTTVDKIIGQSLETIKQLPPTAKDELENLYCSLGKHYLDALKNHEPYWADFQNDQFMYGNKVGEDEQHLYLVDVGAQFYLPGQSRRNPENNEELHPLEWMVHNICEALIQSEKKFQPTAQFEKARTQLLEDIDVMLQQEPADRWLLASKDILKS